MRPEVTFFSREKWSSPEAQARYQQLLHQADEAAKQAARPYLDAATALANSCMTYEYTALRGLFEGDKV